MDRRKTSVSRPRACRTASALRDVASLRRSVQHQIPTRQKGRHDCSFGAQTADTSSAARVAGLRGGK